MSVAKIVDHQAAAADRLLSQSRRPRMLALLGAMTSLVQRAEDDIYPLLEGRFLANATGASLDGIGQIVGQPRAGQTDDVYRLFLQAKIYTNSTDATTPTVLRLVQALFAAPAAQVVSQCSAGFAHRRAPAVLGLEIGSPKLARALWQQAIQLVQQSFAAAVRLSWVSIYDVKESFALDGPVFGAGLDGQATTGGMAELIYNDQGA